MNTNITASAKQPEYPVIDRNPPFTKIVANFSSLDYFRLAVITGISATFGSLYGSSFQSRAMKQGFKRNITGPSLVAGGMMGILGGFMYAYQNSRQKLMGFLPNEEEAARYNK